MHSKRIPALLAVVVLGSLALAPAAALASKMAKAADPLPLPTAKVILDDAKSRIKSRTATSYEIQTAMRELADAHARVVAPSRRDQAAFRRSVEALLLRGFMTVKLDRKTGRNVRAEIGVLAGTLLGKISSNLDAKESKALSLKLRKDIVTIEKKWKTEAWDLDHLEAGFGALAALGNHATLVWMAENYHHTKIRELVFLRAALKAMPNFRDVPGRVRHVVCDELRKGYSGVELVANQKNKKVADAAKKRVWDQLREYVIPVMQHYTGSPKNAAGVALSSMREFRIWWLEHKAKNDAVWEKPI